MDQITVRATLNEGSTIKRFITEHLEKLQCIESTRIQLLVAIDEIYSNIARYAYGGKKGTVTVQMEVGGDPNTLTVTFTDRGIAFNPLEQMEPDIRLPKTERQIGGLGLYMVRKTMDEVSYEYRDGSNILTIRKKI